VIELSYHADIAILRMAHGKANAMSTEFCHSLTARFAELRTAPARAVILTGTGRIFSAGVDLPRLIEGGVPYIREFLPALNEMLAAVFAFPKPVVASINGHAIAGGCVLACAADRRLMTKEAGRIGVTELLVGVPFPAAAMEIMRNAMAPQYFEHAIFSGATFTPDDATVRGLVDEVVEPEQLPGRAFSAAAALAALSPEAFTLSKRQTRQPSFERLARDGLRIDDEVTQIWCAHDTLDRIRDYVARTLKKP
jgi:enoyl-CoA hydratase